jgi:hypothetical protein
MSSVVYQRGYIADLDGTPLDGGKLYIGVANQDPETNPLTVYWDSGLTTPATQPLTITSGYVVNSGARAAVYVNASSYSYRAKNKALVQVDYVASVNQAAVSSIGIDPGTTGLTVSGSPVTGSGNILLGGTLVVANGGTGATTAANARTNLGLGSIATFNEAAASDYLSNTAGKALSICS